MVDEDFELPAVATPPQLTASQGQGVAEILQNNEWLKELLQEADNEDSAPAIKRNKSFKVKVTDSKVSWPKQRPEGYTEYEANVNRKIWILAMRAWVKMGGRNNMFKLYDLQNHAKKAYKKADYRLINGYINRAGIRCILTHCKKGLDILEREQIAILDNQLQAKPQVKKPPPPQIKKAKKKERKEAQAAAPKPPKCLKNILEWC